MILYDVAACHDHTRRRWGHRPSAQQCSVNSCQQSAATTAKMPSSRAQKWTTWDLRLIAWYLLLCTQLSGTEGQFIQPGLCETICHCPSGGGVIDCNRQDQLQGVPTNIPPQITKLYIQGGDFPEPGYLTRANFTGLEHLEHLRVIYCNLRGIEARAFLGMSNLKHLDLSHNALHKLDAYTFYSLQLVNLYLQEQVATPPSLAGTPGNTGGLQLADETFHGLTASQINLRGNGLANLDYALFAKVTGLERLILSDNRITHLDDGFAKYFDRSSRLLDLTGNPLECSCKLAWIAARSVDWGSSLPGLNMTCVHHYQPLVVGERSGSSPGQQHRSRVVLEIRRLTTDQLCPTSRIHHIEVNVLDGAEQAVLDCTAVAIPRRPSPAVVDSGTAHVPSLLTRSPPSVAWRYVESGHLREVKRLPTTAGNTAYSSGWDALTIHGSERNAALHGSGFSSSTVRLNVSLAPEPREYICTTWDDVQEAEEVVVTVKGPTRKVDRSKPAVSSKNIQTNALAAAPSDTSGNSRAREAGNSVSNTNLAFDQSSYLFQEQFSLLQMVGAVIGTCLSTIILILIGSRCIHVCQNYHLYRSTSPSLASTGQHLVESKEASARLISTTSGTNLTEYRQNGGVNLITSSPSLAINSSVNTSNNVSSSPPNASDGLTIFSPMAYPFRHNNPSQTPLLIASGLENNQLALGSGAGYPVDNEGNNHAPGAHPTGILSPANLRAPAISNGFHPNQMTPYGWQTGPPGSPYSLAGSHEYDVPRVLDLPAYFRPGQLQMTPQTPTFVPNVLRNRPSTTMLYGTDFDNAMLGRDSSQQCNGVLSITSTSSGTSASNNMAV